MKKTLIGATLLLALGLVIMPYITGRVAESKTRDIVSQFNTDNSSYGKTEILNYDRGIRNSKTAFKWTPPSTDKDTANSLEYSCDGSHGLLSYSYECQITRFKPYQDFLDKNLNGNDPLSISGKVSAFGSLTENLLLDEFEYTDHKNQLISSAPAQLKINSDQTLKNFDFTGNYAGLTIKAKDSTIDLSDVELTGDIQISEHNLGIGDVEFIINEFDLDSKANKSLTKGITFSLQTSADDENLNLDYGWLIENFKNNIGKETEIEVEDIDLNFAINGLDIQTYTSISEKLESIFVDLELEDKEGQEHDDQTKELMSLLPEAEKFLKKGFGMKWEFAGKMEGNETKMLLDFNLKERMTAADFISIVYSPENALEKFHAQMSLVVPEQLLDQSPALKSTIKDKPIYVKEGDNYMFNIETNGNGIKLNNELISIEELMTTLIY